MKKIFQNIIANVFNDLPRKHEVWLEAIEEQDDLLALQSATRGLESTLSDNLPVNIRTRIIDEAAQKTQATLNKVNKQFVKFEYMDSSVENNMLAIVYGFHKQLYTSYLSLLDDFIANPVEYDATTIHALLSRIVNQAFEMLKWRSFVNLGLSPKIWLQLHKIYGLANDNELLHKAPASNDSEFSTPTLAAQLVQTYMLDSLQQANLNRHGVDIICKILQQQLLTVDISAEFNPIKYLFCVDLDKDAGAKRIRHFTPTDSCIYWQLDDLERYIGEMLDKATDHASLAALTSELSIEPHQRKAIPDTLGAILREWSRKEYRRQRRKEERKKLTTTASVVYGIKTVCERVKTHQDKKLLQGGRVSADGKTLDERLRNHARTNVATTFLKVDANSHHWVIVDESNRGLGAVASSELNSWITVGQLVGIVMADSQQDMIIAVIRSARPKANRQLQVGVEILSRHAKWVQLKPAAPERLSPEKTDATTAEPVIASSNTRSFVGLYLPIEAGLSMASTLILPKIEFVANTQYQISIGGMIESIMLAQSIDSKDDWVKVNYPR